MESGYARSSDSHPVLTDRLGRPLRDLRISVIDQCNFRCRYCMPRDLFSEGHPFLAPQQLLSFPEIEAVVRAAVGLGVRKLKITGGEPLLRAGLDQLIKRLTQVPGVEDVGLITNGSQLTVAAERLRAAGLHRISVSLDSLKPQTFSWITDRVGDPGKILDGIEAAKDAGLAPLKVNMVVQRGINSAEAVDMAAHFRATDVIVRFIEYMDVGTRHRYQSGLLVPSREIRDAIHAHWPIEPIGSNYFGEVADRYRYLDGAGEIGFISSMTQPFCGSCTRLRLAADGKLYSCLFASHGRDLRPILRRDASSHKKNDPLRLLSPEVSRRLEEALVGFWTARDDRYSEGRQEQQEGTGQPHEKVEMYHMGG